MEKNKWTCAKKKLKKQLNGKNKWIKAKEMLSFKKLLITQIFGNALKKIMTS